MKKIATIAAIAAFTTLAACSKEEAPAEAPATEAPAGADNGATCRKFRLVSLLI